MDSEHALVAGAEPQHRPAHAVCAAAKLGDYAAVGGDDTGLLWIQYQLFSKNPWQVGDAHSLGQQQISIVGLVCAGCGYGLRSHAEPP